MPPRGQQSSLRSGGSASGGDRGDRGGRGAAAATSAALDPNPHETADDDLHSECSNRVINFF
ncbi:hypothetical protein V8E54_014662 [Elaphomyces granulatus]